MYGLAIDQQGLFLSSTMETTVFKSSIVTEFHYSLGKFRRRQCELPQSDRHCLRRQRRCLRGRYEQSPRAEIRRQIGRLPHEVRFARNGEGQFNAPWGIAIDRMRGYIYVVDSANFRVQKFDMSGEFIMSWGASE